MRIQSIVATIAFFVSCDRASSVVDEIPSTYIEHEWALLKVDETSSIATPIVKSNKLVNGTLPIGVVKDRASGLIGVDLLDGFQHWSWKAQSEWEVKFFRAGYTYPVGRYLAFDSGESLYSIDTNNDRVVWSRNDIGREGAASVKALTVYTIGNIDFPAGSVKNRIIASDVESGAIRTVLDLSGSDSLAQLGLASRIARIEHVSVLGSSCLLINHFRPRVNEDKEYRTYLSLYDIDNNDWLYEDKRAIGDRVSEAPMFVDGDDVYVAVKNTISRHSLSTGDVKWSRKLPGLIWTGAFTVVDDMVVINCEDRRLYGLNAFTGQIVWDNTEGGNVSSSLNGRSYNGIVYYYNGTSGWLHAVRAADGEVFWRLNAENYDGSELWTPQVFVGPSPDGDGGRVVIQTGRNAYCLRAIE